jgi:hypothetical protein
MAKRATKKFKQAIHHQHGQKAKQEVLSSQGKMKEVVV